MTAVPDPAVPVPADVEADAPRRRLAGGLRLVVVLACLFQLGLGLVWSTLVPPFQGLDERAHVAGVLQLVYHHTWPDPPDLAITAGLEHAVGAEQPTSLRVSAVPVPRGARPELADAGGSAATTLRSQMSQHPPLGYVGQAVLIRLLPDSQHHATDRVLALMRWFSALCIALVPVFAFATMRRFTADRWLLTGAALTPLLLPALARAGGTVSNDPLEILLTSALIYAVARISTGDRTVRGGVLVGGLALLDLLTKGTALIAPLLLLLAYGWSWWRSRYGQDQDRGRLGRSASVAAGLTALGLVWWVRNAVAFGAIQPAGGTVAITPLHRTHDYLTFVKTFYSWISFRFWGSLGDPEPPALSRGLTLLATSLVLTLVVLGVVVALRDRQAVPVVIGLVGLVGILGIVSQGSLSHYLDTGLYAGMQGRYLYPAAIALAPPALMGLGVILRGRLRPLVAVVVLVLAALLQQAAARDALRVIWSQGLGLRTAIHVLVRWAPFSPVVTYAFYVSALAAGALLALSVVVPAVRALVSPGTVDAEG